MTSGHYRNIRTSVAIGLLGIASILVSFHALAQSNPQSPTSAIMGHVHDAASKPAANATVSIERTSETATIAPDTRTTRADSEGAYQFSGLGAGSYRVRAELKGARSTAVFLVTLASGETKTIDLVDITIASASSRLEFFDEPQFTVAGVTQATNSGGHGSDTVLRNSEALVKATASLGREATQDSAQRTGANLGRRSEKESAAEKSADNHFPAKDTEDLGKLQEERTTIQAQLQREDSAGGENTPRDKADTAGFPSDHADLKRSELHHQLAQIDEKLGNPLEAVREYQRASELAPSEPNLFDWASELLTHRALEPATDVFTKGTRLYPESVRMLIGLGVACYARGSYDHAAQSLNSASDLAPNDPTPYLFIGKMQSVETVPSKETLDRLARFQRLEPNNALANYYYALGLWKSKQAGSTLDDASSAQAEALLQKAVQLDPKLGAAHLQLGILYAQRGDYSRAIAAYQKSIQASPELEETHYRLAQAYRRTGDEAKAKEQLRLHEQLSKQSKDEAERGRREIQQFVISLRDGNSNSHER